MSWSAPLAFWFALSLVVIFVLHGIRMFRRRMPTTTLWIWRQLAKESQSSLRLNRIVRNLPLLLQLLLAALLVLALAQPLWFRTVAIDRDVVLIVDASASMNAKSGGSTRFAEAREQALKLVEELHSGQKMALVEMGRTPRLAEPFTDDPNRLRQAIEAINPSDARADLKANLLFALSLAKDLEQRQVVLIGDGAYHDDDGSIAMLNDTTTFVPVGTDSDNVAITQFAYRSFPPPLDGGELLMTLHSYRASERSVTTSVALDGTPPLRRDVSIPPGASRSLLIPVPAGLRGVARAQLLPGDELESDDRAFAVIAGREGAKVLLVGEPDPPLHAVLQALPALDVTYRDSLNGAGAAAVSGYDLVVFNRVPPPPMERGTALVLGAASEAGGVQATGWVDRPRITGWLSEEPLLRYVDVQRLEPGRALALAPEPGTEVLVEALEGALITRRETGLLRVVSIGFDLRASRVSAQDAFPLLMANLVESARGGGDGARQSVAAGEGYVWRHPGGAGALKVTSSDGRSWEFPASSEPLRFEHTERIGIYTFEGNGRSEPVVVNLLDDRESRVARNTEAVGRAAALGVGRGFGEVALEGWPWFVLAGLLFLLVEWLVWSRFT